MAASEVVICIIDQAFKFTQNLMPVCVHLDSVLSSTLQLESLLYGLSEFKGVIVTKLKKPVILIAL